jgi:hypothetical protein
MKTLIEYYDIERQPYGYIAQYGVFTNDSEATITKQISNRELVDYIAEVSEPVAPEYTDDNWYDLVKEYITYYTEKAELEAA